MKERSWRAGQRDGRGRCLRKNQSESNRCVHQRGCHCQRSGRVEGRVRWDWHHWRCPRLRWPSLRSPLSPSWKRGRRRARQSQRQAREEGKSRCYCCCCCGGACVATSRTQRASRGGRSQHYQRRCCCCCRCCWRLERGRKGVDRSGRHSDGRFDVDEESSIRCRSQSRIRILLVAPGQREEDDTGQSLASAASAAPAAAAVESAAAAARIERIGGAIGDGGSGAAAAAVAGSEEGQTEQKCQRRRCSC